MYMLGAKIMDLRNPRIAQRIRALWIDPGIAHGPSWPAL